MPPHSPLSPRLCSVYADESATTPPHSPLSPRFHSICSDKDGIPKAYVLRDGEERAEEVADEAWV
ncbi:hypothetical protein E2562_037383 [Oryza meyeriana var. granulata]|uniref:Uncharacterized protein n=1 Tax=Oryza meyeriana var. granulata TaxID=110450 RepID=A0A6G1E8S7_9ORYZ|nr:hypothetical protein E2562_037383 [Oryza meyeriana var. granulata]